jgi:hypothetical protein
MSRSAKTVNTIEPLIDLAQDWSLGWRYETVALANGRTHQRRVPLTAEEARHPEEGYVMPERTEHNHFSDDLLRYAAGVL